MSFVDPRESEKEVLITVKAYPNPSKKYRETVCVAGVVGAAWIRLYPIQFRFLTEGQAFKKYELIRVRTSKHTGDPRPESHRPDQNSIVRLKHFDTRHDKNWTQRKERLLPTVSESMCWIQREQKKTGRSLGMFKPIDISKFEMIKDKDEWSDAERWFQMDMFNPGYRPSEQLPYSFRYHYRCADPGCKGHKMKIIDWEAGQLYRNLRDKYHLGPSEIEAKMRKKWLEQMFASDRDSYFFVGNMRRRPHRFVLLGVFWPPKL